MPSTLPEGRLKLLQNPTKVKVVVLLSEGDAMTVTQMSRQIGLSRPNLYHAVSEMVKEGILERPSTKVSGNYVEKYYRLKPDALGEFDYERHKRAVMRTSPSEFRDLIRSVLLSVSMNSRILADRLSESSGSELSSLKSNGERVLAAYFTLSDEAYDELVEGWRKLLLDSMQKWSSRDQEGGNKLAIYALPDLRERKRSPRGSKA